MTLTRIALGGFGLIAHVDAMLTGGFDFAELDMPELSELSEREYEAFRERCLAGRIPILAGSRILPVTEPLIFTEGFRCTDWRAYLEKSVRRSARLGMRKCIFGNGKARRLLDETSLSRSGNFVAFMRMISEIAGENGMDFLLEPLGPRYSNFINTLAEGCRWVDEVNMPNFHIMADIRHMLGSGEDFSDLADCAEQLRHVHLDYPLSYPERRVPSLEDDYDYGPFFSALKKAGYSGTLTVESDIPADWSAAGAAVLELLQACGVQPHASF